MASSATFETSIPVIIRGWCARVVNTGEWWSGHDVLVAVRWINTARWMGNAATVVLTCQVVEASPAYDLERTLDREQEATLFKHHGKPGYRDDQVYGEAVAPQKEAPDILNERYASGEITREQFVQMKSNISEIP